ncbi:skg6p [Saccharomyces arboricola H-6]|uniref:Skg6p n=1 Tax=Saccharomyces arboricola (strain H-6 / AS 2.3317 / CBS 10644) TaxID=1160507 RepID=J8Q172_SACAR|nr:skg6p [Saccharomyces arboricola H-6]
MYHTHMRGSWTSVAPVTSTAHVEVTSYAYERLARRDDDESSSSSGSSTQKSKSAKCTGSNQSCQLPADSSHSTNVTVGVAVAVPVGVIIIVLGVILYIVYRRSKREAEEDNDPDFEGDSEFLPAMNDYPSGTNHPYSSDSQQDFLEKTLQQPPTDPFANSLDGSRYNVRSTTPSGIARPRYIDPFQLPQESSDSNSLRDFAMKVQSDGFGGYKVAASSRNASQTSLHPDNFSSHTQIRESTGFTGFQGNEGTQSQFSPIDDSRIAGDFDATTDAHKRSNDSKAASDSATISKEIAVSIESDESPDNDAFEFEFDNGSEKPQIKGLRISTDNDYELQDIKEPQYSRESSGSKGEDEDEDYYASHLSPNEEENIQRMKSIYQVYLDRAKTMKKAQDNADGVNALPKNETSMGYVDQNPLPSIQISNNNTIEVPEVNYTAPKAATVGSINSSEYGSETAQKQDQYPVQNTLAVNGRGAVTSARIASSIYSEAIQPLSYEGQYQQQEQSPVYGDNPQNLASQYNEDFEQQGYPMPVAQNQQWYGAPTPKQQQYNHPQTLETIGELPTPAYLAQSTSSHSLTSFKRPNKQQLLQLQTARLNGTALNPVDHPEMFYSPTNDAYYAPQQQGRFVKSNENGAAPSPYQLRQSVVMTNPSDLIAKPSYKPAGSFRSVSASNSRNNSLTTQNNAHQYLQQQQQQQYNSRVSGLLEETDVVQPPSVGGILPHSGSQDDLRRQLGSSHNYAVN